MVCPNGTPLYDIVTGSGVLSSHDEVMVKAIISVGGGFPAREDIFEIRLRSIYHVQSIIRYESATCPYTLEPLLNKERSLSEWLQNSPLALVLHDNLGSGGNISTRVESDLKARLCVPWMCSKAAHSTVVVVGGGETYDLERKLFTHRDPFEAAKALNMSLIILDEPGHGLQQTHLDDWDYSFIAMDMTQDEELPSRILDALKDTKLDGITTFSQRYITPAAKAAERLGLRTEPVAALEFAHNKHKMREALGTQFLKVDSSSQLQGIMLEKIEEEIRYPLIVKPCVGSHSFGVSKAVNRNELHRAVQKIEQPETSYKGILIEPYVDGPEVDANFVLWEGELLFCEITDQTPCRGDASNASASEPFVETTILYPSGLTLAEQDMIKTRLYSDLIKLGFRSGLFHLEARVRNSATKYQNDAGIVDLVSVRDQTQAEAEVYLVEVNARRPPGYDVTYGTLMTHGVDYFGLQLLSAVGDESRIKALSIPFAVDSPQLWAALEYIPLLPHPVHVPRDFCDQVLKNLTSSHAKTILACCFWPDRVGCSVDGTILAASFIISSCFNRRHVLQAALEVQEVSRDVLMSLKDLSG